MQIIGISPIFWWNCEIEYWVKLIENVIKTKALNIPVLDMSFLNIERLNLESNTSLNVLKDIL